MAIEVFSHSVFFVSESSVVAFSKKEAKQGFIFNGEERVTKYGLLGEPVPPLPGIVRYSVWTAG